MEESDAIGLNIALDVSKKPQEEISASSKANDYRPTLHASMISDTTTTATSTAQEGHNYGGRAYYKDDD